LIINLTSDITILVQLMIVF